jgi:hypothetical protein
MLGPRNNDLKSISDFNSAWADRVAFLILVGLAVDIAAIFILGKTWPENGLTIAANSLIAIGVWGELWFAKRAREADDGRVAEATARAAEANARAAEASLALEQFKAARALSPEQQRRIADKLKQFAGTAFDAGIGPKGDPEPLYLIRDISAALVLAGWEFIAWTGGGETYEEPPMPEIGLTMVTNVLVDVHPDHWGNFGAAASALVRALADEDIVAVAGSRPTTINAAAIHIRIGRKQL